MKTTPRLLIREIARALLLGFATGAALFSSWKPAAADAPNEEKISITSTEDIIAAYGVVFGPFDSSGVVPDFIGGAAQRAERREAEIREKPGSKWEVVVKLRPEDYSIDNQLTAIATTKSGKVLASRVRTLGPAPIPGQPTEPSCGSDLGEGYFEKLLSLDNSQLRALVEIRQKKRDLLLRNLRQGIGPELSEKVQALEEARGLQGEGAFSPRLTPSAMTRRLVSLDGAAPSDLERPAAASEQAPVGN